MHFSALRVQVVDASVMELKPLAFRQGIRGDVRMSELEGEAVGRILAALLGWVRDRLERMPVRDFSQATRLQKIGRLALCFAILVGLGGPLLWFVFR
jgi:hypothetical protein